MAMRAAKRRLEDPGPARAEPVDPNAILADALAFRNYCLGKWANSDWDNKTLCDVAWFATKAGARGMSDFAVNPEASGSNHSKKVRSALKLDLDRELYTLSDLPVWDSKSNKRTTTSFALRLPHEALLKALLGLLMYVVHDFCHI
jgi:hypothetical protein